MWLSIIYRKNVRYFLEKKRCCFGNANQGIAILFIPFAHKFYQLAFRIARIGNRIGISYFLSAIAQATTPHQRHWRFSVLRI
jgi:hypothetical protein